MKLIKRLLAGSFVLGGFVVLFNLLHAQEIEMTAIQVEPLSLKLTDLQSFSLLSDAQVTALISALDATPTVSADALPRSGTYWSLANPTWPPLPGNINGLSAWTIDGGSAFLLNDVGFDYTAQARPQSGRRMMSEEDSPPGFDDIGDGTNVYYSGGSPSPVDYGTNLWIAQVCITNGYLAGIGTNTEADIQYEIQSRTNLASQSDWQSEGFILGDETTNWTPLSVAQSGRTNLFIRLRSWADDGSGLPIWWQQQYFGTNGIDAYGDPDGDGWNNQAEFLNGTSPTTFNAPPAPQNLTLQVDGTGTNVTLTWQSGGGNVSQYKVEKTGYWEGHTTNYMPASQTTFATSFDQTYFGSSIAGPTFQVTALFANGAASAPTTVNLLSFSFGSSVQIVHTAQGQFELLTGNLRADAKTIRLFWQFGFNLGTDNPPYDIPVSNIVNGVFVFPNSVMEGYPSDKDYGTYAELQYQSGQYDWQGDLGYSLEDQLVVPGLVATNDWQTWINASARVVKDNLIFLLRSATVNHSFSYESIYEPADRAYIGESLSRSETGSDYEYSGYRYHDGDLSELVIEKFRPMAENYLWRNYADFGGSFVAGASYNYSTGQRTFNQPDSVIQSSDLPPNGIPSSLLANDTASYYFYRESADPAYEPEAYGEVGLVISGTNVFLPTEVKNIYGLPVLSVMGDNSVELTAGGASLPLDSFDNTIYWYVQTAFPSLSVTNYYFASQTPHDIFYSPPPSVPGTPGFAPTNTSPLLITGIGQNFNVTGWAKEAIVNGYTGKFAYLEQFFDRAYQVNTNGVVTTNRAGPLSSYGNFFATQPGKAALMTMPDIDTGQRGTCMVYCVSLQLDKNHDGNMDLSFNGADATAQANPMKFWVNNDWDLSDPAGDLGHDVGGQVKDYNDGFIESQRDLEDFARLWLCGMPALPVGQNYSVTLSLSAQNGTPAVNLFDAVETNGGTAYLTDPNVASNQVNYSHSTFTGPGYKIATISSNQSFTFPADYFTNGGNKYFLFEGAGIGVGQLTLTISQGSNVIAQTSAWLDLHDVKELFQRVKATPRDPNGIPGPWTSATTTFDETTADVDISDDGYAFSPCEDESKTATVFVHGSNLSLVKAFTDGDTMFKRLYWQGYNGRFVLFYWNTLVGPWDGTIPAHYNFNEYRAFKYGLALKKYVETDLPTNYVKNVIGHSMGNMVVTSALYPRGTNAGMTCRNVIFMQAAVPASCFDSGAATLTALTDLENPQVTPDGAGQWGYRGLVTTNVNATLYNIYNANDFALGWWVNNQELCKPENLVLPFPRSLSRSYAWSSSNQTGYLFDFSTQVRTVVDPQESMSFIARSRTEAAGRVAIGGSIQAGNNFDVGENSPTALGRERPDHSGEFTRPIQQLYPFYRFVFEQVH